MGWGGRDGDEDFVSIFEDSFLQLLLGVAAMKRSAGSLVSLLVRGLPMY